MTRTTKANDVPHNNPDAAAIHAETQVPKFFGKQGFADTAPSKTKKDGGGKGNWGQPGDELQDELDDFHLMRARRRSNSITHKFDFKTKFEVNDPEPVFEEHRHGPVVDRDEDGEALSETTTTDSTSATGATSGSGEALFRP